MTNLSNLKNEIKLDSIKTFFAVTIVVLLGWGVSSSAVDDIKSATINFNAIGVVSGVSDKEITLTDAKGSNSSSDTTYDLNLDYLVKIETSAYTPLNLSDIKVGNKIIAQGLTNNSKFFIKRIISFDSIPTPIEPKDEVATTTATTTPIDDIAIATTTDVGTSTLTEDVIEESTGGSSDTATPVVTTPVDATSTTTATTTESFSTTTPEVISTTTATTTDGIIDTITSTIGDVIDAVVDVVQNVVDTVVGSSTPNTAIDTVQENPPQEIPIKELIDNSSSITPPIN
jgi:hypothetical protein